MEVMLKVLFGVVFWIGVDSRIIYGPSQARLSIAEPPPSYYLTNIDGVPGTYRFGYTSYDNAYRTEERHPNGTVTGSYGYIDAFGRPQRFRYIADSQGYRVSSDTLALPPIPEPPMNEFTEPSITWTRPKKPNKNSPEIPPTILTY